MQTIQILRFLFHGIGKKRNAPLPFRLVQTLSKRIIKKTATAFAKFKTFSELFQPHAIHRIFRGATAPSTPIFIRRSSIPLEMFCRMLPMRAILLRFHTLFLHAAQVSLKGTGILFTAPSGTGKTTQAKLWKKYRNGQIVCSDRTLARKINGVWKTYGYPLDGSEPVRSGEVNRLGCIVLLRQDAVCRIERLRPAKAVGSLMQQAVMDCWDGDAKSQVMELFYSFLRMFRCICSLQRRMKMRFLHWKNN